MLMLDKLEFALDDVSVQVVTLKQFAFLLHRLQHLVLRYEQLLQLLLLFLEIVTLLL